MAPAGINGQIPLMVCRPHGHSSSFEKASWEGKTPPLTVGGYPEDWIRPDKYSLYKGPIGQGSFLDTRGPPCSVTR